MLPCRPFDKSSERSFLSRDLFLFVKNPAVTGFRSILDIASQYGIIKQKERSKISIEVFSWPFWKKR